MSSEKENSKTNVVRYLLLRSCWLISAVLVGLIIGYLIGVRAVGISFLKEIHRTASLTQKQNHEFTVCWEDRADSVTENLINVSGNMNTAISMLYDVAFPHYDAIKIFKSCNVDLQWCHKTISEPCETLYSEYRLPKLPWALQMMVDNGFISRETLGTETILPVGYEEQ
jgi:hypothetical protein